jgi:hypothetical protein
MDAVLDGLVWSAGPRHAERLGRLLPKGEAADAATLRRSEVHCAALRDLDVLADV